MSGPETASAFLTLVERYEGDGWVVRTIDRQRQRATVQTHTTAPDTTRGDSGSSPPQRRPTCRKLWVDAQGEVQATDVPC